MIDASASLRRRVPRRRVPRRVVVCLVVSYRVPRCCLWVVPVLMSSAVACPLCLSTPVLRLVGAFQTRGASEHFKAEHEKSLKCESSQDFSL